MSDDPLNDQHLDEKLAEITDQILNQESSEFFPPFEKEEGLLRLQKVILRLKQTIPSERPDPEFLARLRTVLQEEWQRSGPKPVKADNPPSLIQQFKNSIGKRFPANPARSMVFVGAVLALLVLLLLLPPGVPLDGAAGTGAPLQVLEYGLGLLCLGLLVWILLKRHD